MIQEKQKRRKLRHTISDPLRNFVRDPEAMRLIFHEKDHDTAMLTRAAIGMYIGRHDFQLTTRVFDKDVWVLKYKDILDPYIDIFL